MLVSPVPNAVTVPRKHPSLPLPMRCAGQAIVCPTVQDTAAPGGSSLHSVARRGATSSLSLAKGTVSGCPGSGGSVLGKGPSLLSLALSVGGL